MKLAGVNAQLKNSTQVKWMNNFDKAEPDVTITSINKSFISNDYVKGAAGRKPLKDYSVASISALAKGKNLFVNLPPTAKLNQWLIAKFSEYKTIQFVNNPSEAHYVLYGTIDDNNNVAYGLVKSDISTKDSLSSMPIASRYFTLSNDTDDEYQILVDSLFEASLKLSKIRGWLTIAAPKDAGFFPYHLTMTNTQTNKEIDATGVKIGDILALSIEADENYLDKKIETKYVYVFTIDIKGKMQLIYPGASDGNNQNKFPFFKDNLPTKKYEIMTGMEASDPVGTDNYFLIASKEPITGYNQIFNQDGVRGADPLPANPNPLSSLLNM
jgi:hypothetical protein